MKIKLLFFALMLTVLPAAKAQYNLFEASDVDADGWLWFNSQAKINKYIGVGKAIELQNPAFDTDTETAAQADVVGVGTDAVLGGTAARTGAIVLPASSVIGVFDGGGILMYLPSCSELSLSVSSEYKMIPAVYGFKGKASTKDLAIIKGYSVFGTLSPAGQKKWENIQNLTNLNSFKLASASSVTALIRNGVRDTLYIHGIKVMTPTPTSVSNPTVDEFKPRYFNKKLTLNQMATVEFFSVCGSLELKKTAQEFDLTDFKKGVYMVRIKTGGKEGCTKIFVY